MFGNGQVFISHAHEDNAICQPLLAALDAWQITYWFDLQELDPGQRFADKIQQALEQHDLLLRVATAAAERSYWMYRELQAVRGLQHAFPNHPRRIIHLALTPGLVFDATARAEMVIDATSMERPAWLRALREALGYTPQPRVSRRTAIAIGAASLVAAATTVLAARFYFAAPPHTVAALKPATTPQSIASDPKALAQRWHYDFNFSADETAFGGDQRVGLAQDMDALYAATNSGLAVKALAPQDGKVLWLFPSKTSSITTLSNAMIIQVYQNVVYLIGNITTNALASNAFVLLALDKTSGNLLWQSAPISTVNGNASDLLIADNTIYFMGNGSVYAYRLNGTARWQPVSLDPHGGSEFYPNYPMPVYASGMLYVVTNPGKLYALDAVTGKVRWSLQLPGSGTLPGQYVIAAPLVFNGLVVVGSPDNHYYAYDAARGTLRWKSLSPAQPNTDFQEFTCMSQPTYAQSRIFAQSGVTDGLAFKGGRVFAFDATDGHLLWQVDPLQLNIPFQLHNAVVVANFEPATVIGDTVYFTLGCISTDGNQQGVEVLIGLRTQDGTLVSYFLAPVSGVSIALSGDFPSGGRPVANGLAFLSSAPILYVLNT